MKKIIVAFTLLDTPWSVLAFATKFAMEHSTLIHAIFLRSSKEETNSQYPFPNDLSITEEYSGENISISDNEIIDNNIKILKDECNATGILFTADKDVPISQLIENTWEADLLIADSKFGLLENVLPHIHCPAFLVSRNEMPQAVVLMYNDSASSQFAIEKYILLLPEFKTLITYMLSVNSETPGNTANEKYLEEKLQTHFKNPVLKMLHGNVANEMKNFIDGLPGHIIVVMGAFGRSAVSMFFHQSLANSFLDKNKVSLFIAHK